MTLPRKPTTLPETRHRGSSPIRMHMRTNWHHTWDQKANSFWADGGRALDWPKRDRPANPGLNLPALTFLGRAVLKIGAALSTEWRDGDSALPRPGGMPNPSSGELDDNLRLARELKEHRLRTEAWKRVNAVRLFLIDAIEQGRLTVWHLAKETDVPSLPERAPAEWWCAESYDHLFRKCDVVARVPHAKEYTYADKRRWLFVDTEQLQNLLSCGVDAPASVLPVETGPITTERLVEIVRAAVRDRKGVEPTQAAVKSTFPAARQPSRDRIRELHGEIWLEVWKEAPSRGANSRKAP